MEQKIMTEVFINHIERLVASLDKDHDAFFLLSGKEEGSNKPKTKTMYIWLMGYDMIETIFLVTRKSIIYLASAKKLQMLEEVKTKLTGRFNFVLLVKSPSNLLNLQKIQEQIQLDAGKDQVQLLCLMKEKQTGALAQEWTDFTKSGQLQQLDSTNLIQQLLCVKDAQEVQFMQQSAQLTSYLMKKIVAQIEHSIDQSLKVKHSDIANKIEQLIDSTVEKQKLLAQYKLVDGSYDLAFVPIIQSGGQYSLSPNATSNSQYLSTDVILLSAGGQVNVYTTAVSRTLFIDPTEKQKRIYNLILDVENRACVSLVIGTKLSEVWLQCRDLWNLKKDELGLPDCPTTMGYGIGLEFREATLAISEKNDRLVELNQTYLVQVSIENLTSGQKGMSYAVNLADVVLVCSGAPQVLTQNVPKQYKSISYQLQDEEEEAPRQEEKKVQQQQKQEPRQAATDRTRGPRNQQIQQQRLNEQQRQQHQSELTVRKQQELEERLQRDEFSKEFQQNKSLELNKLTCYRQPEQMPRDAKKGQIYIDHVHQSVLLPFQGTHLPFHVSCIKNVSKIDEGRLGASIRINFFTTETSAGNLQFPEINGQTIFLKELQCRSRTIVRLQELMNQIKQLQKKVKAEQQVEREKAHTGEIEQLLLNKGGRKPVFKDLKIRPTIASGRGTGILEVHLNGFRYIYNGKENVDIPFKNIKHYIYQSPENEIIAALHFHLVSPIILGKKKTQDIQFYCEVGGGVEHLEGRKRNNKNDDDEIEDEERQRLQRRKMHREFEAFIKSVEETSKDHNVVFDKPYRDLGFEGNWNRARMFLQPTLSTLMNVIEAPFFILTINEVEIACFERVMPGIKSFDLAFIFKNYEKPVLRLESIDTKDFEGVKNWLDRMNILFFEIGQNLVWKNVLATIQKDIQGFVEDGGWGTVLGESDDEGEKEEEAEAADSEFTPDAQGASESSSSGDDDDDGDANEEFDEDDDDDDDDDDEDDLSDVVDLDNLSEEEFNEVKEDRHKKPQHNNNNKRNPMKHK